MAPVDISGTTGTPKGCPLTHANLRNDDAALRECAELLTPLRDAWKLITPQKQAA